MIKTTVFVPGHISGFFQPVYHKNIFKTGSRGAGINLNLGATATVEIEPNEKQKIEVISQNKPIDIPIVTQVIKHILGQKSLQVHVNLTIDLPISQGFGMSAANALSTSLALSSILQIPKEYAWMAAHRAEIEMKTGLGDVAAQIKGGIEIREKPGIPPWGQIRNIPGSWNIIICSIDSMIQTSEILQNKEIQEKIITLGKKCTDTLLEKPTFQHFFELSQKFTIKTGLATKSVIEALDAIKPYGMASMSMLGNSVFAIGNTDELINILSSYGMVQRCTVDQQGGRIIQKND